MILTKPIGIDLGTTNSAVAMLDLNERDLLLCRDPEGRSITPSCVWSDPRTGNVVVGHRAYARRGMRPEPISSIKRSMGTQMTVTLGNEQRSPIEISAYILRELKRQMEQELARRSVAGLRYEISPAIITVPAYFSLPAIEATREAGRMAGLEVMELLHEPTAAAIYYSWKHNLGDGTYMVYDLGGGTFDVSILDRTAGEFLVLGISGDNFLGGDDFDRRLAEYLRMMLVADGYNMNLDVATDVEDRLRFNQLMGLAENAKKELSKQVEIMLRNQGSIQDKSGASVFIETVLSRATFEDLIDDLLDRTLACCEDALQKAHEKSGVTLGDIDYILLVGGSTYVPVVVEKVKKTFCRDQSVKGSLRAACEAPIRDEPETAVALGAALRAAASGLGVGDDGRSIRLWFRSAGATKRERTTINGHVEPLQQNLVLEGGLLRLQTASGNPLGEVRLGPHLHFAFPTVPLHVESLNEFRFEVQDRLGKSIATLQRSIVHASDQKEAVGRTLSTAVLAKPIILEGTDGTRLVRRILLSEGTPLPTKAEFTFAVADPAGQIRLPIYQGNRVIKELQANIGNIPAGTAVAVTITCDEQVHIQVHFSIRDREFGGKIEPPPPDSVPTEYELRQIDVRFLNVLEALEQEDARRLKATYERTRRDLNEASGGADYAKVIQRAADLEGLIREAHLAEPLQPPLKIVEDNFKSCLERLPEAAKVKTELAASTLRQELEMALEKAKQAYTQRDRQTYQDASDSISAILQFLTSVLHMPISEDENVDIAIRADMALRETQELTQLLFFGCLVSGEATFSSDLGQMLQELNHLEKKGDTNPVEILKRCQVIKTRLHSIYQQLSPQTATTDAKIKGLLKVDAQGQVGNIGVSRGMFNEH